MICYKMAFILVFNLSIKYNKQIIEKLQQQKVVDVSMKQKVYQAVLINYTVFTWE